jgi:hypothetical protein
MTCLEAAYRIFKQAEDSLHYREITARTMVQVQIQLTDLTPEIIPPNFAIGSLSRLMSRSCLASTKSWIIRLGRRSLNQPFVPAQSGLSPLSSSRRSSYSLRRTWPDKVGPSHCSRNQHQTWDTGLNLPPPQQR